MWLPFLLHQYLGLLSPYPQPRRVSELILSGEETCQVDLQGFGGGPQMSKKICLVNSSLGCP